MKLAATQHETNNFRYCRLRNRDLFFTHLKYCRVRIHQLLISAEERTLITEEEEMLMLEDEAVVDAEKSMDDMFEPLHLEGALTTSGSSEFFDLEYIQRALNFWDKPPPQKKPKLGPLQAGPNANSYIGRI